MYLFIFLFCLYIILLARICDQAEGGADLWIHVQGRGEASGVQVALYPAPAHPTVSLHLLELRHDYESLLETFLFQLTHLLSISVKFCLNASKRVMGIEGQREKRKQTNTSDMYSNSSTVLYCEHCCRMDRFSLDSSFPTQQSLALAPVSFFSLVSRLSRPATLLLPSVMPVSALFKSSSRFSLDMILWATLIRGCVFIY